MVWGRDAEEESVGDRVAEAGLPPVFGGSPVANPGGGEVERDGEWLCFFGAAEGSFYRPGRRWPSRAGTVRWRGELSGRSGGSTVMASSV